MLTQGSLARVNPPLRTAKDVKGIIAGLKDGTIDAIATDHAPHSAEEKARTLTRAPSGMIGLETSLAVTLTELYHTGKLKLPEIIKRMTYNPASILRLSSKGRLSLGSDADITIFDPNEEWTRRSGTVCLQGPEHSLRRTAGQGPGEVHHCRRDIIYRKAF